MPPHLQAPVWAALAAAHGQQPGQGAEEPASCGAMADAERAAQATAALEARLAAMLEVGCRVTMLHLHVAAAAVGVDVRSMQGAASGIASPHLHDGGQVCFGPKS